MRRFIGFWIWGFWIGGPYDEDDFIGKFGFLSDFVRIDQLFIGIFWRSSSLAGCWTELRVLDNRLQYTNSPKVLTFILKLVWELRWVEHTVEICFQFHKFYTGRSKKMTMFIGYNKYKIFRSVRRGIRWVFKYHFLGL